MRNRDEAIEFFRKVRNRLAVEAIDMVDFYQPGELFSEDFTGASEKLTECADRIETVNVILGAVMSLPIEQSDGRLPASLSGSILSGRDIPQC